MCQGVRATASRLKVRGSESWRVELLWNMDFDPCRGVNEVRPDDGVPRPHDALGFRAGLAGFTAAAFAFELHHALEVGRLLAGLHNGESVAVAGLAFHAV